MKSVEVYSTPACPWCRKLKQFLEESKAEYQDMGISEDKTVHEEVVNKTGQMAVPVIDIDSELAAGFDAGWIKQKLGLD